MNDARAYVAGILASTTTAIAGIVSTLAANAAVMTLVSTAAGILTAALTRLAKPVLDLAAETVLYHTARMRRRRINLNANEATHTVERWESSAQGIVGSGVEAGEGFAPLSESESADEAPTRKVRGRQ